jgi:CheY-like chemotaxis protein/HPt (histidine-containing phosphotransfer) domain-containing protein
MDIHPQAPMNDHAAGTPARRALLVEDGPVDRMVSEFALKRLGYTIVWAGSVEAALLAWGSGPFDLALLDMHLPDGEGWDLAATLRQRETTGRRTPMVALSASTDAEDRARCRDAGTDEFLAKPLDAAALARFVEAAAAPTPVAAVPPAGEAPPIDLQQLDEATMGSDELRSVVVGTFLGDVRTRIENLSRAIGAGDARATEFEAHGLKGMSATLGARACAAVFAELERIGREHALGDAPALLERARHEVAHVERYFEGSRRAA